MVVVAAVSSWRRSENEEHIDTDYSCLFATVKVLFGFNCLSKAEGFCFFFLICRRFFF